MRENKNFDISTVGYLPPPTRKEVRTYQRLISTKFDTNKSLAWIPHISIADRVLIPRSKFNDTHKELKKICRKISPINIVMGEVHFWKITESPFENPFIISVDLVVPEELIMLRNYIQNIYKGFKKPSYKPKEYKPHITLAYRDLTEKNFNLAKKFFKENPINLKGSFILSSIHLVVLMTNERRISIKKVNLKT